MEGLGWWRGWAGGGDGPVEGTEAYEETMGAALWEGIGVAPGASQGSDTPRGPHSGKEYKRQVGLLKAYWGSGVWLLLGCAWTLPILLRVPHSPRPCFPRRCLLPTAVGSVESLPGGSPEHCRAQHSRCTCRASARHHRPGPSMVLAARPGAGPDA